MSLPKKMDSLKDKNAGAKAAVSGATGEKVNTMLPVREPAKKTAAKRVRKPRPSRAKAVTSKKKAK